MKVTTYNGLVYDDGEPVVPGAKRDAPTVVATVLRLSEPVDNLVIEGELAERLLTLLLQAKERNDRVSGTTPAVV